MSKPVKDLISQTLRRRFEGVQDACVVDLTGLDVERTRQLRRSLRAKSMRVEVVKNSLARRAFADGPLQPLGERLRGPCALVTGGTSVVEVAKALIGLAKDLGHIKLKEAIVEGGEELFSVEAVSKMKSRGDLLGELAALVSSPGRALAGCLQAGGRIAACLKTLADRPEAA